MLVAKFSQPEYRPDYGTVAVRDTRTSAPDAPRAEYTRDELSEAFSRALPCGSLARSGEGWLQTRADDAWQTVDLESHDSAPPAIEHAEDVMETPYICRTGAVALDFMIASVTKPELELKPGCYRVRVSRWIEPDGPRWCLQFWPQQSVAAGPRWVRRTRPTDAGGRSPYAYVMSDLVALALWAGPRDVTLAELADTLLITDANVTEVLRAAIAAQLLAVRGEVDAATTSVHLTAPPSEAERQRREKLTAHKARTAESRSRAQARAAAPASRAAQPPSSGQMRMAAVTRRIGGGPPAAELALGAPLRVGVLTGDGRVFLRHGQELRSHASLGPGHWNLALQSGHGTVVVGSERSVLVRSDGRLEPLTDGVSMRGVVSTDGATAVIDAARIGRQSRYWLHRIDLATTTRDTVESDTRLWLVGIHDTAIYYQPDHWSPTLRWLPGHPPEPLPYRVRQVDPITGILVVDDEDGTLLIPPNGPSIRSRAPKGAQLTPGARFWHLPVVTHPDVVLHLFSIDGDALHSVDLPAGSATNPMIPSHPIWENPTTLVVSQDAPQRVRQNPSHDIIATRVDIVTGALEAVTAPRDVGHRPTLIDPLLTT